MKSHLNLFGAVATVYREDLCLDKTYRQNENWLKSVMQFYVHWHSPGQEFEPEVQSGYHYHKLIESMPLYGAVQKAKDSALKWIVPVLDRVQTLEDVLEYEAEILNESVYVPSLPLEECSFAQYDDTAIRYLINDPLQDLKKHSEDALRKIDEQAKRFNYPQEVVADRKNVFEKMVQESQRKIHTFLNDKELHQKTLEELERRKMYNTELLKKYGIH